jgi:hypothetical protein
MRNDVEKHCAEITVAEKGKEKGMKHCSFCLRDPIWRFFEGLKKEKKNAMTKGSWRMFLFTSFLSILGFRK